MVAVNIVVDCVVDVEVVDAVEAVESAASVLFVVETVGIRVAVVVSGRGVDVLWPTVTSVVVNVADDEAVVVAELVSNRGTELIVDVISLRSLDGNDSARHPVSNSRKHKHSVTICFIIKPSLRG